LLTTLFRRIRYGRPIILVSGLPRSGTSMMMKMLKSGGVSTVSDNLRKADADNPKGYFELEAVKNLGKTEDFAWLEKARGKAIKVVSQLLRELPGKYYYRVVFMERDLREVIASQNKMLDHRGEDLNEQDGDEMMELFESHLRRVRIWLRHQPNFDVLYVRYPDVLNNPAKEAERIQQFLGVRMNLTEMARPVDPALYRNRS